MQENTIRNRRVLLLAILAVVAAVVAVTGSTPDVSTLAAAWAD